MERVDVDATVCEQGSLYIMRGSQTEKARGLDQVAEVKKALDRGATLALTTLDLTAFPGDAPVVRVDNLVRTLSRLAEAGRARFEGPVVGITGSVGKTLTKELMSHVLSYFGPTHATRGNYNEIDSVLMEVASIPAQARFAVLEVCSTMLGSVPAKSRFVKPTVAMVTNIGHSHGGNYPSRYDILRDKTGMIDDLVGPRIAILGRGVIEFDRAEEHLLSRKSVDRLITVGNDRSETVAIRSVQVDALSTRARIDVDGAPVSVFLPFAGRHFAEAAAFVLATALALDLDVPQCAETMANLRPLKRRGERHRVNLKGSGQIIEVIDDAQNASPDSVRALLDNVRVRNSARKVLVFGDMLELGAGELGMHADLAPDVVAAGVDVLVTVGDRARALAETLEGKVQTVSFETTEAAAAELPALLKSGDLVALKGSNGIGLDRLLPALAPGNRRARAGLRWTVEGEVAPDPATARRTRPASVKITGFHTIPYRMPLRKGFTTSRHTTTTSFNYVLVAEAGSLMGLGEASPRSIALTGDTPALADAFFRAAAPVVTELELDGGDPALALDQVRSAMSELEGLAQSMATDANRAKPLRAALAGVDMMLLDLAARAHRMTVADFLGRERDDVGVTATTLSITKDAGSRLTGTVAAHLRRYPALRAKGDANLDVDLAILKAVTEYNDKHEQTKIAWVDLNEACTPEMAKELVERIVDANARGEIRGEVVLEQPVPKRYYAELCELQKLADKLSARTSLTLTLLADESLWDGQDLERLQKDGGCGAINIKIQKCGGLLRGLDVARQAVAFNPKTRIYLGGMIGTSDLTSRALLNLAAALPRFDFITSGPKSNIGAHIAAPPLRWVDETNVPSAQQGPGLGIDIDWGTLAAYVSPEVRANTPMLRDLPATAELTAQAS